MGLNSFFGKILAKIWFRSATKWIDDPVSAQDKTLIQLIAAAKNTAFGQAHDFKAIKNYEDFKAAVPIIDYEQLKPYINRIKQGEKDVLWPKLPLYFAKTSGTTSGVKYIPITKESVSNHINSTRNALFCYILETNNADFLDGNLMFLSGAPTLDMGGAVPTGRLSGIVNHHIPNYLKTNQVPSLKTNCITDWETKLDKIVDESLLKKMTLIGGIPPWVQMYFDKLNLKTGKTVVEAFPHLQLFVYGGVNFEPYRAKMEQSLGNRIDSIELFPASEGFFAFQDKQKDNALLLLADSGIFFEFIPLKEFDSPYPTRIHLGDVKLNENYVLIINSNAGLWGYNLGDTVKFTSLFPHKIKVTGRVKHYISAFGEHVIGEEVEDTIKIVASKNNVEVIEFHVAPQVTPLGNELPYHEWFVEFGEKSPANLNAFAQEMDTTLRSKNVYYNDLITGNILQKLVLRPLKTNSFIEMMRNKGKLGGQNKVPRLANNRDLADDLAPFILDQ